MFARRFTKVCGVRLGEGDVFVRVGVWVCLCVGVVSSLISGK